jgi:hypothetical protein
MLIRLCYARGATSRALMPDDEVMVGITDDDLDFAGRAKSTSTVLWKVRKAANFFDR